MRRKYKVRYELGDKSIEISRDRGIRIWVDCDDISGDQPDPEAVAAAIADWLNSPMTVFPSYKIAAKRRIESGQGGADAL